MLEILAARGVLQAATPAFAFFQIADAQQMSSPSPKAIQRPGQRNAPSALETILKAISDWVSGLTQQLDDITTTIAEQTYVASSVTGGFFETSGVRFTAGGGTVFSLNFHTLDYNVANYQTKAPEVSTSVLPSAGIFVGFNLGVIHSQQQGISPFFGKSAGFSKSALTVSYNSGYKAAGLSISNGLTLGWPGGTYTEQSETNPVGTVDYGNAGRDIESIENTLWNMSQDPISGKYK